MQTTNSTLQLALLASAVSLVLGCSSESTNVGSGGSAGSAGSGGAPAACTPMCDALDSAKCPAESKQVCLAVCTATTQDCPGLTNDLSSCVQQNQAQLSCDSDGKVVFTNCESQWLKILPCSVCIPKPTDTAPETCLKQKCCGQIKEAYSRSDVLEYISCVTPCTIDACRLECGNQYPETAEKFAALESCQTQACLGTGG